MEMEKTISIHLTRLQRHYEHSIKTYDDASLLDMAHVLRIWTELKPVLTKNFESFRTARPFRSGSPQRKILKQLKKDQYIFCYLPPAGVETFASNGNLVGGPDLNQGGDMYMGVKIRRTPHGSITLSQFSYLSTLLESPLDKAISHPDIARLNFGNWMGSEIVRLQYINLAGELEQRSISREILIKRVANTLEGSHTSLNDEGGHGNQFDESVKWLLKFSVGGLPVPYFLLLKIARDIVDNVPSLLDRRQ